MTNIADEARNIKTFMDSISNFFEKYIGKKLLRKCGIFKIADNSEATVSYTYVDNELSRLCSQEENTVRSVSPCIAAAQVLVDKILIGFLGSSLHLMLKTNTFFRSYKKDVFYRFDRMKGANWERLQLETAKNVISDVESRTKAGHVNVLIFDDSLYERKGGKGTELAGQVFDHCDMKTRIGYRMMTGGWSNGEEYIPFQQCLLTTRKPDLMVGPDRKPDQRTLSGKRWTKAKQKGTEVMFGMVQLAQEAEIPFDYVLFDSWFSNAAQVISLKAIGADTIAMVKKNDTKYGFTNDDGDVEHLNIKQIFGRCKKRRGRSKYLLSLAVTLTGTDGKTIPVRLVFARNHSNKKDWVCFICTDMDLSEKEILRIYLYRWKTECYFKVCKSYLKLRTECHSTSYDAITAHMVIVALRYMILTMEEFDNGDHRSIAEIMHGIQREVMCEIMFQTGTQLLDILFLCIREYFRATEEQMNELMDSFIDKLPAKWKPWAQRAKAAIG